MSLPLHGGFRGHTGPVQELPDDLFLPRDCLLVCVCVHEGTFRGSAPRIGINCLIDKPPL